MSSAKASRNGKSRMGIFFQAMGGDTSIAVRCTIQRQMREDPKPCKRLRMSLSANLCSAQSNLEKSSQLKKEYKSIELMKKQD
jgi:hypothetical protein